MPEDSTPQSPATTYPRSLASPRTYPPSPHHALNLLFALGPLFHDGLGLYDPDGFEFLFLSRCDNNYLIFDCFLENSVFGCDKNFACYAQYGRCSTNLLLLFSSLRLILPRRRVSAIRLVIEFRCLSVSLKRSRSVVLVNVWPDKNCKTACW